MMVHQKQEEVSPRRVSRMIEPSNVRFLPSPRKQQGVPNRASLTCFCVVVQGSPRTASHSYRRGDGGVLRGLWAGAQRDRA